MGKSLMPKDLEISGAVPKLSVSFQNFPKLSVSFRFVPQLSGTFRPDPSGFRFVPFCSACCPVPAFFPIAWCLVPSWEC